MTTNISDAPIFRALRDAIRDEMTPLADRFTHLPADDAERPPLRARITDLLEREGRLLQAREGVLTNPPSRDEVRVAIEGHEPKRAAAHARVREINRAIADDGVAAASGRPAMSNEGRRDLIDRRAWLAESARIADAMHDELRALLAVVAGE